MTELGVSTLKSLQQPTVTTTYEDYQGLKCKEEWLNELVIKLNRVSDYDEKAKCLKINASGEQLKEIVEKWFNN